MEGDHGQVSMSERTRRVLRDVSERTDGLDEASFNDVNGRVRPTALRGLEHPILAGPEDRCPTGGHLELGEDVRVCVRTVLCATNNSRAVPALTALSRKRGTCISRVLSGSTSGWLGTARSSPARMRPGCYASNAETSRAVSELDQVVVGLLVDRVQFSRPALGVTARVAASGRFR